LIKHRNFTLFLELQEIFIALNKKQTLRLLDSGVLRMYLGISKN